MVCYGISGVVNTDCCAVEGKCSDFRVTMHHHPLNEPVNITCHMSSHHIVIHIICLHPFLKCFAYVRCFAYLRCFASLRCFAC